MSSSTSSEAPSYKRESLKEMKKRKRREMLEGHREDLPAVVDPYTNANASARLVRGGTGIVFDKEATWHKCEWDEKYPENPTRLIHIIDKCNEYGYLRRCVHIANPMRTDLYNRIIALHSKEHYHRLKDICNGQNIEEMEEAAANYDAIYFNVHTFKAALRAVSSVLNLVTSVASGEIQNGMAFVRPPGHHAMHNEYNGYCFFNNVAIAANTCIESGLSKRVLIVDFDVHHGQGIQRMFYDRRDVLYFSIHRYEHGTFWPNLLESNFNYIGSGEGLGYNINVPLNAIGLTNDDYLAIVFSILLPVAYEFNPDLVIVCAGYDAAIGCPEGQMNVTPAFYCHLITLLSGLAKGRIAVCLEGGYFLDSLGEGAAMTLKGLLGGPCPKLDPITSVHPTVVDSICNVRRILLSKWTCFKFCEAEISDYHNEHEYQICYMGYPEKPPYLTRACYPENNNAAKHFYSTYIKALAGGHKKPLNLPVTFAYDEAMLLHKPKEGEAERPERPERISEIIKIFGEFHLLSRLVKANVTLRDYAPYSPHGMDYLKSIGPEMAGSKDVYVNKNTKYCTDIAASSLMKLVDDVMSGSAIAGVAVIRPPGHHAEYNRASGFCLINNVAIAANYLIKHYKVERILIVDFDVHHGNGTQTIFYNSKQVMYISIHRRDDGKFFPAGSPNNYTFDGHCIGQGYNINIPFDNDKMGDSEYIAAFQNIVLPAAYSYAPEIVLVSAGFDAGINDPLGGYQVSPETFGHFIQMLKPLAEGRIILSLEGGYNLTTTALSMAICTKVLLGDPVMMPNGIYKNISFQACRTIRKVIHHFKKYYNIFTINKRLALTPVIVRQVKTFNETSYNSTLTTKLDIEKVENSDYVAAEFKKINFFFCVKLHECLVDVMQ